MLNSYSTNAILMRILCRDYRRNHGTYYQENLRVDFSFNDILWCRSAQPVSPHSAVLQLQLPKEAVEIDLFFWFIRRSANHDVKEWESGGASRSIFKMWHGSYNNVMFLHFTRWKSAKYHPGLLWTSFSFHFPSSLAPFAPFSPSPVAASLSSSVLYSQQSRWGFGVPYWEERRKKKRWTVQRQQKACFPFKSYKHHWLSVNRTICREDWGESKWKEELAVYKVCVQWKDKWVMRNIPVGKMMGWMFSRYAAPCSKSTARKQSIIPHLAKMNVK